MTTQTFTKTASSYSAAGWAAIGSGTIGIFAVGSLIGYLVLRSSSSDAGMHLNRFHDAGVMVQFLLLIPALVALQKISQRQVSGISQASLITAILAICCIALCLLLIFPEMVSDILYMLPQGIFGVVLIFICLRTMGILSKGLRWFGIVVGFGLTLVGFFFVGYTIFVSTIPLRIPAASMEEAADIPITQANIYLHYFLDIGTLLGVLTLPCWTILVGRRLLREKRSIAQLG